MQYKFQNDADGNTCAVTIVGQNISIPMDESNTDYQEYLEWLEAGNEPIPADQPE
jgi:hypothetical protein